MRRCFIESYRAHRSYAYNKRLQDWVNYRRLMSELFASRAVRAFWMRFQHRGGRRQKLGTFLMDSAINNLSRRFLLPSLFSFLMANAALQRCQSRRRVCLRVATRRVPMTMPPSVIRLSRWSAAEPRQAGLPSRQGIEPAWPEASKEPKASIATNDVWQAIIS